MADKSSLRTAITRQINAGRPLHFLLLDTSKRIGAQTIIPASTTTARLEYAALGFAVVGARCSDSGYSDKDKRQCTNGD